MEEAKNKLDHPTWIAMGSLKDEFACVTKRLLIRASGKTSHIQVASGSQKPDNAIAAKLQNDKVALPDRTAPFPSLINPPSQTRRRQDMSKSSSSTAKSRPGSPEWGIDGPPSSISTVDTDTALRGSREHANLESLTRCLESAERKLDDPIWKEHGHLGDDFACITKEVFHEFVPPQWYSVQLILAWRASIMIPNNWVLLVADETWKKGLMSKDTTDIIHVNFENARRHFTMTHFSIASWEMVYYDSQLSWSDEIANQMRMWAICHELVKTVRLKCPTYGISIRDMDPRMSRRVSQIHLL